MPEAYKLLTAFLCNNAHTAQSLPVTTLFTYDSAGRLTGYEHTGAGTTASLPADITAYQVLGYHKATYYYDANGNRTRAGYTYPKTTGAGNNTLDRQFSLNGNRIQAVNQYQIIDNQYSQTPARTLSWDTAGNLLFNGITSHSHNAQAQVASSTGQGQTTQYLYNSASQRVRKSGAATIDYSYGLPELQMDNWPMGIYQQGPQAQTTEIIYLPTSAGPLPVAADINGELYAIHTDHLNTPRRLTNSQGQAVWQWVISGFGEMPATTASNAFIPTGEGSFAAIDSLPEVTFALRYPGQVEDEETGLFYNHHRYYDPYLTVGYTQADPIGLAGGWNRFGYVGGNPLLYVDPLGLWWTWGDPLPQGLVDAGTGFGDGVFTVVTFGNGFGFGAGLSELREIFDIGEQSESTIYGVFETAGNLVGMCVVPGALNLKFRWITKDGPHKGMGPHLHYGSKYPNSTHPKLHFGPKNPNHGKSNFSWSDWFKGGRPWRWK